MVGRLEEAAIKMREAYAEFCGDSDILVPWPDADPQKKRAWRCCARAAESVFLREELKARASED